MNSNVEIKNRVTSLLRGVRDFPYPGFNFLDVTPLLETDPVGFSWIIDTLKSGASVKRPGSVLCVESFGYVFGAPLAVAWGAPIVLARKSAKLPREVLRQDYKMVYSARCQLEIHRDAISAGSNVVIVDDVLATGGTLEAAVELVRRAGGVVSDVLVAVEVNGLCGRRIFEGLGINVVAGVSIDFRV